MADYTEHYHLHQWQPQDKFLRTDFNEDLQKIDTVLDKHEQLTASHEATIAKLGNCQIVYGNYTGTGTYGASNPSVLSFESMPVAVFIMPVNTTGGSSQSLTLLRSSKAAYSMADQVSASNAVSWDEKSVSWYSYANSAQFQLNQGGTMYGYVALLMQK